MKILVSGAGGFIGGQITRELLRRGHEVVALTRNPAAPFDSAEVVALDLLAPDAARNGAFQIRYDAVIHAAALIPRPPANAGSYSKNEAMTQTLLRALGAHPPAFLLAISTIDVYSPVSEVIDEDTPVTPATEYAASKVATERVCAAWAAARGCPFAIARLTQVFGPDDRTTKFIPAVVSAIRSGKPVKLFGDGEDRRDYLFVNDAGVVAADWAEARFPGVLNVATGRSHTMNDVLGLLHKHVRVPFGVERLPRVKERRDYRFDIARLLRALGPRVFVPLSDALGTTFDGHRP